MGVVQCPPKNEKGEGSCYVDKHIKTKRKGFYLLEMANRQNPFFIMKSFIDGTYISLY